MTFYSKYDINNALILYYCTRESTSRSFSVTFIIQCLYYTIVFQRGFFVLSTTNPYWHPLEQEITRQQIKLTLVILKHTLNPTTNI